MAKDKYQVRLTLSVEADSPEDAVSEFALTLAEFGTLNWLFFVENLTKGEASYINRSGEELDESTLGYMQQALDAYKVAHLARAAEVAETGKGEAEQVDAEPLAGDDVDLNRLAQSLISSLVSEEEPLSEEEPPTS